MVKNLIVKLGGAAVVARWCGGDLNGNAVTAWGLRNHIPWRWRQSIATMAADKGLELTAREAAALNLMFSKPNKEVRNGRRSA